MRVILAALLFMVPALANACSCDEPDKLEEIYRKADGIYMVALSGIAIKERRQEWVDLDLELSILKSFKGGATGVLKAQGGTSSLPTKNDAGDLVQVVSSCDWSFTFGDLYIVATMANEILRIAQCSNNIIDISNQEELVRLNASNK